MSRHDVIVIGAGFTGLSAATALFEAGFDIILLEARDRVGGRVESHMMADGSRADSGGQFFCDDMVAISRLVDLHGKTRIAAPEDGDIVFQPPMPLDRGYEVMAQVEALRARMVALDADDPALAGMTAADWLEQQDVGDDARIGFHGLIEGLWCCGVEDISFPFLVSNDQRITNTITEMQWFLGETMHGLAEDIASRLGERVVLDCPVTHVIYGEGGARVKTERGVFEAAQVIVALPPVMAGRLAFEPPLPASIEGALSAWRSGSVIKVLVRYQHAFWRDVSLSGTIMWRMPSGLYACDVSRNADDAALVLFIGGPLARHWHQQTRSALETAVLDWLTTALGDKAASPIEIDMRDWTDDAWSGGAYCDSIVTHDHKDAEKLLRQGLPAVTFACSELATSFPGYIEGAIVAGRLAAERIIADPGVSRSA